MYICDNISINEKGTLTFAGQDTTELAKQYGTPLYLMDEDRIRYNCRVYKTALNQCFDNGGKMLYAGKACCFKQMYRIMQDENVSIDVVSPGEIYTAMTAGFDMSEAYYHGNNKTDDDIKFAIDNGVGQFVVDNFEEVLCIEKYAEQKGIKQKVLIRITPGIDTHTYAAINTGKVDSKFGNAIETGQAEEIVSYTLGQKHIELVGFHCHVGSQVFKEDVFERTAAIMLKFIADIQKKTGYLASQLDLGGGYGVRYVAEDPMIDIASKIKDVADTVHEACKQLGIPVPFIMMEPGRSIVADSGMTLYTVGAVKTIPGYKDYVSIDGGMTDNPRFALYGSKYLCLPATRMNERFDYHCSVVGKCCESGDIIQEDVVLPRSIKRGDILAVCTTGAYNFSMASNYNRFRRPPVVMLKGGESYVAVKRESFEDLTALDV